MYNKHSESIAKVIHVPDMSVYRKETQTLIVTSHNMT